MFLHARKAKSYKGTSIKTGLGRRVFFGRCKSSIAIPVASLFYASPHSSEHKANSWTSTRLFSSTSDKLAADIEAVGDKIRKLKATQAEKSEILPYINKLLALKAQFEMVTGAPLDSSKADRKTKTKSSMHSLIFVPLSQDHKKLSALLHCLHVMVVVAAKLLHSGEGTGEERMRKGQGKGKREKNMVSEIDLTILRSPN